MTTRAKVYVESVKLLGGVDPSEEIQFRAIYSGKKNADDCDEDNTYSKYTPSFDCRMNVTNPKLHGVFKPGQKYYVDFSLSET